MESNLNDLPRKLAERLTTTCPHFTSERQWYPRSECSACREAVIREAIEQALDAAKELADKRWEVALLGQSLHNTPKQYVAGLQDASRQISEALAEIRSLKPAKQEAKK